MKGERTMKGAVASSTWLGLSAFVRRRRYLFSASTTEEKIARAALAQARMPPASRRRGRQRTQPRASPSFAGVRGLVCRFRAQTQLGLRVAELLPEFVGA